MLPENRQAHVLTIALFLVIGCVFYLMNVYSPLYVDDWHYCFIFGTTTPIASIGDIFRSQAIHYMEFNGRVVPHLFVQFFDGLVGKPLFNVVNTVLFLLFLHLLTLTIISRKGGNRQILTFNMARGGGVRPRQIGRIIRHLH